MKRYLSFPPLSFRQTNKHTHTHRYGGKNTHVHDHTLSGFLPRLSIFGNIPVTTQETLTDEKRRRVDVRMLAHHAAARIFNSIDKESSSARSRDGLISFADMIGWLSRNGLSYHLKDEEVEEDYPPLPEDEVLLFPSLVQVGS